MSTRIFILILILLAIDLYVFFGMRVLFQHKSPSFQRTITLIYWGVSALCFLTIILGQFTDWHMWPKAVRMYSFALIVIIFISKIFAGVFLLVDDMIRLLRLVYAFVDVKLLNRNTHVESPYSISRLKFLVQTGLFIGSLPFFSMIYGMIRGAYHYQVRKVKLAFKDLPSSFDGLRIVQISDLHTGSFMGPDHLSEAVDMVLSQKPDIICVTGDLVNDRYTEAVAYRDVLSRLKAPMGVFSILGNHDYGDYYKWETMEDKIANLESMKTFQREIGWDLLLNEHRYVERGGERIGIIGVENYSARRNFSRYGDLHKAVESYDVFPLNILLSHDPSHWNAQVTTEFPFINLTLSGHTHGFQFGVDSKLFRWSPVQYVYDQWADLYRQGEQFIYVNRGLGFIGYPGRVGIRPEITVLEISRG